MKWVRLVHRWLGLILSVFIILISLSGGTLIFKDNILRATWPELSKPITPLQIAAYPEVFLKIEMQFQETGFEFIRFPRDGKNVFQVWLKDESQAFVDPETGEIISQWHWYDSFITTVTDGMYLLHSNLFAGERGEIFVGCVGIVVLFFVFSGLILWWPRRSSFKLIEFIPKKNRSKFYLRSHNTIGVISSLFIILFVVTGVTMVFYRPVTFAVVTMMDPELPMLPSAKVVPKDQPMRPWSELLSVINSTLAKGSLQSYSPPKKENAVMVFRKRMPEEWHAFGRTFILIDPYTSEIVQLIDARKQHKGMSLMEKVYPLHASTIGGLPYKLIAIATAILLLMMTVFGLMSYILRYKSRVLLILK
jgi:uncharacterized iron-regulated membrane protein